MTTATSADGPATNWGGNVAFQAKRFLRPASLAELQDAVAGSDRLRALGTGHSFNRIADTTGDLVLLTGIPPSVVVDAARSAVTVGPAVRYGELTQRLHEQGRALPNLGSLPHISVAGACATGTHGSGDSNGILGSSVSALEMVTATGQVVSLSRLADPDEFCGAVTGLGSLGIVTSLTLDTVPAFDVAQLVYEDMPWAQFMADPLGVLSAAYSVSVFTDWGTSSVKQVWLKRRTDVDASWTPEPRWLGATLAAGPRHPVPGMSPVHCTQQLGVPGPWHERLPHFRLAFTPSSGEELQSEYSVAREVATDAIEALLSLGERIAPVVQCSEIRTVASDDFWMSPSYQRDSVAFHFTWVKDEQAVIPVVEAVEERLQPFSARPHWGKIFRLDPELLGARYQRWSDFRELLGRYDPDGKFRNDFIDTYFPADG